MNHFTRAKKHIDKYRGKLANYRLVKPEAKPGSRKQWVVISDLHVPFVRDDLVKEIIRKHSGADGIIVNGDLFDNYLISKFPKSKEIPFIIEYNIAFHLILELSQHFGQVILVDGNHELTRWASEVGRLNQTIRFMVKSSPLKYIADGREFSDQGDDLGSINLPNVHWAGDINPYGGSWFVKVGEVICSHRTRGFRQAPMSNTISQATHLLNSGINFQVLISGHSHHAGCIPFRGRWLIDQGALMMPMEYESDGSCKQEPPDLGYATFALDRHGNVDLKETKLIWLGTYQRS